MHAIAVFRVAAGPLAGPSSMDLEPEGQPREPTARFRPRPPRRDRRLDSESRRAGRLVRSFTASDAGIGADAPRGRTWRRRI